MFWKVETDSLLYNESLKRHLPLKVGYRVSQIRPIPLLYMTEDNRNSYDSFREKLDLEYTWPSMYTFKFIVPQGNEEKVRDLFPGTEVTEKMSRKGNYISLTARLMADSSEAIIVIYQRAQYIEGLIAL